MSRTRFLVCSLLSVMSCLDLGRSGPAAHLSQSLSSLNPSKDPVVTIRTDIYDVPEREFFINYAVHTKDFVARGDMYQVSVPMHPRYIVNPQAASVPDVSDESNPDSLDSIVDTMLMGLHGERYTPSLKTCEISVPDRGFSVTTRSDYTGTETRAAVDREFARILYELLHDHREDVINCLLTHYAVLDGQTKTINLVSSQKATVKTTPRRVLVSLSNRILTVKVME